MAGVRANRLRGRRPKDNTRKGGAIMGENDKPEPRGERLTTLGTIFGWVVGVLLLGLIVTGGGLWLFGDWALKALGAPLWAYLAFGGFCVAVLLVVILRGVIGASKGGADAARDEAGDQGGPSI
jgi:hypothetical protein